SVLAKFFSEQKECTEKGRGIFHKIPNGVQNFVRFIVCYFHQNCAAPGYGKDTDNKIKWSVKQILFLGFIVHRFSSLKRFLWKELYMEKGVAYHQPFL
ncbi:MAG: hypothetical protein K2N37_04315, partial [Lachnospiraceae bacterium]|nr:hypothetical protein [Lachnospiraceae bacterium]